MAQKTILEYKAELLTLKNKLLLQLASKEDSEKKLSINNFFLDNRLWKQSIQIGERRITVTEKGLTQRIIALRVILERVYNRIWILRDKIESNKNLLKRLVQ